MPQKVLDTIKETLLYSKLPVIIPRNNDRSFNSSTPADRTDQNLSNRITSFNALISQKLHYRIPLKYFVDLGLVNFPEKTNTKFIFMLESNKNKRFESNVKVIAIPRVPDAQILYHDTPYISYQQITLNENFQVYFNATLQSKMALRNGVQFSPHQQSFEGNVGTQTVNVNFQEANRQYAWIEISLAYDRSDQHQTICDSYNAELATTKIQSLKLENALTTYSLTSGLVYDIDNKDDKHCLYLMLVA